MTGRAMDKHLLQTPCDIEVRLAAHLRKSCVTWIEAFGDAAAGERLNLAEVGVRTLVWYPVWELEKSLRVASALGLIDRDSQLSGVTTKAEE